MPLAKDHSNLPAPAVAEGTPPSPPHWTKVIAAAWTGKYGLDDSKPMAHELSIIRCSQAGACSRQIAYTAAGLEASNPLTIADHWRFGVGTTIHDQVQAALADHLADSDYEIDFEVPCALLDGKISGHADAVIDGPEGRTLMEIKSINGFGFKQSIGARGPAEGPRDSALLQASLYGMALDADEVAIVYLSTENLSPREASKIKVGPLGRFAAEWRYPKETFLPLANREVDRFTEIIEVLEAGPPPAEMTSSIPRSMPALPPAAVILNPGTGQWVVSDEDGIIQDTGSTWQCNYCPHQKRCTLDAAKEGLIE